jgi:ferrochelatase
MRFSDPSIEAGLRALAVRETRDVVAIVLSPQYSPLLMGGYATALEAASVELGDAAPRWSIAEPWHDEPEFVGAVARRIDEARARFPRGDQAAVRVLLTAHSLPRRVADRDPAYLAQLHETAVAVARAAHLADDQWTFCWQSAGHEPGEWMKPDFADLMPAIGASGPPAVIVAPVQFLADHLEILYDIDVGAREQADRFGVRFERIASLNDDPGLIAALAAVARRNRTSSGVAAEVRAAS